MSSNIEHTKEELQRTVREVLRVVWLRRWAFFIPFCIAASVVFAWSHKLPRVYKASTVFERLNTPAINKVLEREGPASMDAMRRFMADDMLGIDSLLKVADRLGLTKDLPRDAQGRLTPAAQTKRRGIANRLRGKLEYHILFGRDYLDEVRIDAAGEDPQLIVKLANAVRDNYVDVRKTRWLGMLTDTRNLYRQRLDDTRNQINERDRQLKELEDEYPFLSPYKSGATRDLVTADRWQLGVSKSRIETLDQEIQLLEQRLAQMPIPKLLAPDLSTTESEMFDDEAVIEAERKRLRNLIFKLDNDLTVLRIDRTEKHPGVQELRRKKTRFVEELEVLNRRMAGLDPTNDTYYDDPAQAETVKLARQGVEHELKVKQRALASAQANVQDIEGRLEQYQQYREEGSAMRPEYSRLAEEQQALKSTMGRLQTEESEYARILDIDATDQGISFKVKRNAETSRRPILPKPESIMLLAIGVGLAFGACAVFLREFFDHTYRTATAVNFSLGVPILEGIDEILLPADRRRLLVKRLVAVPMACLFIATISVSGTLAWLSLDDPPAYKKIVSKATTSWEQIGF